MRLTSATVRQFELAWSDANRMIEARAVGVSDGGRIEPIAAFRYVAASKFSDAILATKFVSWAVSRHNRYVAIRNGE